MKSPRGMFKKMAEKKDARTLKKVQKVIEEKTGVAGVTSSKQLQGILAEKRKAQTEKAMDRYRQATVARPPVVAKDYNPSQRLIDNIKFGKDAEKSRENIRGYNEAKADYASRLAQEETASRTKFEGKQQGPTTERKVYRPELGGGDGEGRRVNQNQPRPAAKPKTVSIPTNFGVKDITVSEKSADIGGQIMIGAIAMGLTGGRVKGAPKTNPTAAPAAVKAGASTAGKQATTSLFKQSGTAQAGKGFWKDFGTGASTASKNTTSTVGQNTVKQTTSTAGKTATPEIDFAVYKTALRLPLRKDKIPVASNFKNKKMQELPYKNPFVKK
jgi:hypothetical protein